MNMQRRDRGRPYGAGGPDDNPESRRQEPRRDAGAYIGRMPERATETIPGGVGPKDVRVSAVGTEPAPVREDAGSGGGSMPEGHREGEAASDARVREAGQNR